MATKEEMLADELRRAQAALAMERRINSELAESLIHYIKKENEAAGMNSIQAEIHAEARFKEVVRKLKIACFAEFERFRKEGGRGAND